MAEDLSNVDFNISFADEGTEQVVAGGAMRQLVTTPGGVQPSPDMLQEDLLVAEQFGPNQLVALAPQPVVVPRPLQPSSASLTAFGVPATDFVALFEKAETLPPEVRRILVEFQQFLECRIGATQEAERASPGRAEELWEQHESNVRMTWENYFMPKALQYSAGGIHTRRSSRFDYSEYVGRSGQVGDAARALADAEFAVPKRSSAEVAAARKKFRTALHRHLATLQFDDAAVTEAEEGYVATLPSINLDGCWDSWNQQITQGDVERVIERYSGRIAAENESGQFSDVLREALGRSPVRNWLPLFGIAYNDDGTDVAAGRLLDIVSVDMAKLCLDATGTTTRSGQRIAAATNVVALSNNIFVASFGRALVHVFPYNATSDDAVFGGVLESLKRFGVRLAACDSLLFHGGNEEEQYHFTIVVRTQQDHGRTSKRSRSIYVFWFGSEQRMSLVLVSHIFRIKQLLANHITEQNRLPAKDEVIRFSPSVAGAVESPKIKRILKVLTPDHVKPNVVNTVMQAELTGLAVALEIDGQHAARLAAALPKVPEDLLEVAFLELAVNGWAAPAITLIGSLVTRAPRPDVGIVHAVEPPGAFLGVCGMINPDAAPIWDYSPEQMIGALRTEYERWKQTFAPAKRRAKFVALKMTEKETLVADVLWGPDGLLQDRENRIVVPWFSVRDVPVVFATNETYMIQSCGANASAYFRERLQQMQTIDLETATGIPSERIAGLIDLHAEKTSQSVRSLMPLLEDERTLLIGSTYELPNPEHERMPFGTVFVDPLEHVFSDMIGGLLGLAGIRYTQPAPEKREGRLIQRAEFPYIMDYRTYVSRRNCGGMFPFTTLIPSNPCAPLPSKDLPRWRDPDVIRLASAQMYERGATVVQEYINHLLTITKLYTKTGADGVKENWTPLVASAAAETDVTRLRSQQKLRWRRCTDFVCVPGFGPHLQPWLSAEACNELTQEVWKHPAFEAFANGPTQDVVNRARNRLIAREEADVLLVKQLMGLPSMEKTYSLFGILHALLAHFRVCQEMCTVDYAAALRMAADSTTWGTISDPPDLQGLVVDVCEVMEALFPVTQLAYGNPDGAFKRLSTDAKAIAHGVARKGDVTESYHGTGTAATLNTASALDVGWVQALMWTSLQSDICRFVKKGDAEGAAYTVYRTMRGWLLHYVRDAPGKSHYTKAANDGMKLVVYLLYRRKAMLVGEERTALRTLGELLSTLVHSILGEDLVTFTDPVPSKEVLVCRFQDLHQLLWNRRTDAPEGARPARRDASGSKPEVSGAAQRFTRELREVQCRDTEMFASVARFVRFCLSDLVKNGPPILQAIYGYAYNGFPEEDAHVKIALSELAVLLKASYRLFTRPTEMTSLAEFSRTMPGIRYNRLSTAGPVPVPYTCLERRVPLRSPELPSSAQRQQEEERLRQLHTKTAKERLEKFRGLKRKYAYSRIEEKEEARAEEEEVLGTTDEESSASASSEYETDSFCVTEDEELMPIEGWDRLEKLKDEFASEYKYDEVTKTIVLKKPPRPVATSGEEQATPSAPVDVVPPGAIELVPRGRLRGVTPRTQQPEPPRPAAPSFGDLMGFFSAGSRERGPPGTSGTSIRAQLAIEGVSQNKMVLPRFDEKEWSAKVVMIRRAILVASIVAFSKMLPFLDSGLKRLGVEATIRSGMVRATARQSPAEEMFFDLFSHVCKKPRLRRILEACLRTSVEQLEPFFSRWNGFVGLEDDSGYVLRSQVTLGDLRLHAWQKVAAFASLVLARRLAKDSPAMWLARKLSNVIFETCDRIPRALPSSGASFDAVMVLCGGNYNVIVKRDGTYELYDGAGAEFATKKPTSGDAEPVAFFKNGTISIRKDCCGRVLREPLTWFEAVEAARSLVAGNRGAFMRALKFAIRLKIEDSVETLFCSCGDDVTCDAMPGLCLLGEFRGVEEYTGARLEWIVERLYGAGLVQSIHSIVRRARRCEYSVEVATEMLKTLGRHLGREELATPVALEFPLVGCEKVGCICGPVPAASVERKTSALASRQPLINENTLVSLTDDTQIPMPVLEVARSTPLVLPCCTPTTVVPATEVASLPVGLPLLYKKHPPSEDVGVLAHGCFESAARTKERGNASFERVGATAKLMGEMRWQLPTMPQRFGSIASAAVTKDYFSAAKKFAAAALELSYSPSVQYVPSRAEETYKLPQSLTAVGEWETKCAEFLLALGRETDRLKKAAILISHGFGWPQLTTNIVSWEKMDAGTNELTFISRGIHTMVEALARKMGQSKPEISEDGIATILSGGNTERKKNLAGLVPRLSADPIEAAYFFETCSPETPAEFYAMGVDWTHVWGVFACRRRWTEEAATRMLVTATLLSPRGKSFYAGPEVPKVRQAKLGEIFEAACASGTIVSLAKSAVERALKDWDSTKTRYSDANKAKLLKTVGQMEKLGVEERVKQYALVHQYLVGQLSLALNGDYLSEKFRVLRDPTTRPPPLPASPTIGIKKESISESGTQSPKPATKIESTAGTRATSPAIEVKKEPLAGSSTKSPAPSAKKELFAESVVKTPGSAVRRRRSSIPPEPVAALKSKAAKLVGTLSATDISSPVLDLLLERECLLSRRFVAGLLYAAAPAMQTTDHGGLQAHSRWGTRELFWKALKRSIHLSEIVEILATVVTSAAAAYVVGTVKAQLKLVAAVAAAITVSDVPFTGKMVQQVAAAVEPHFSADPVLAAKERALLTVPMTWMLWHAKQLQIPVKEDVLPAAVRRILDAAGDATKAIVRSWACPAFVGSTSKLAASVSAIAVLSAAAAGVLANNKPCTAEIATAQAFVIVEQARTGPGAHFPAFLEREYALVLCSLENPETSLSKIFWRNYDSSLTRYSEPIRDFIGALKEAPPMLVLGTAVVEALDPEAAKKAKRELAAAAETAPKQPTPVEGRSSEIKSTTAMAWTEEDDFETYA